MHTSVTYVVEGLTYKQILDEDLVRTLDWGTLVSRTEAWRLASGVLTGILGTFQGQASRADHFLESGSQPCVDAQAMNQPDAGLRCE